MALGVLLVAAGALYLAGELLVSGLLRLAQYFRVREFVVAFFVMAFAASVPNFFVGVTSSLQGIPELSFGDIMGNNMVALTLAVGLAIWFAPGRQLPLESKVVQNTAFLTAAAALLPVILLLDGTLSRGDGIVLILFFVCYVYWLFSEQDHFSKPYEEELTGGFVTKREAFFDVLRILGGMTLLAVAAQGIVYAAGTLAVSFGVPLILVGLLVLGFAGALPELYFTVISARKGATSLIIGNLMGAVIVPATLVLGIVVVISPIENDALEFPLLARIFLAAVAVFFFYLSRTKNAITDRESWVLFSLYVFFLLSFLWPLSF